MSGERRSIRRYSRTTIAGTKAATGALIACRGVTVMMRIAMMTMMITRADVTRPLGRGVHTEREREPDHYDDDDTDHDAGTADIVLVIMQGHVSGEASGDDDAGGVEVDDPYSHISNSSRSGNNYLRVAQSWQLQRNKCRRRRRAGRSGRIRHKRNRRCRRPRSNPHYLRRRRRSRSREQQLQLQ